jgi:hypothetical protein
VIVDVLAAGASTADAAAGIVGAGVSTTGTVCGVASFAGTVSVKLVAD